MYTHKHTRGFTLIELLVVIAIIGVLSSVVLASLNTARQKSRDAKRQSDVKQLQLALQLYFDTNGAYPSSTNCGAANGVAVSGASQECLAALVSGTFIASIPTDPLASQSYQYRSDTTGTNNATRYCVGANLEGTTNTLNTCNTTTLAAPHSDFSLGP